MCVLNGRVDSATDDYTCVSWRGKSVVDYMIVQCDEFDMVKSFKVFPVSDLLNLFSIMPSMTTKLPDHSVLMCELVFSEFDKQQRLLFNESQVSNKHIIENTVIRKYNLNKIPTSMFCGDSEQRTLTS